MPLELPALPEGIFFFELAGQKVFPLYGASGGIGLSSMVCLIKRGCGKSTRMAGRDIPLPSEGIVRDPDGWAFCSVCIAETCSKGEAFASISVAADLMKLLDNPQTSRLRWIGARIKRKLAAFKAA